jgi:nucleoside 2-deoxyribosyltransferase
MPNYFDFVNDVRKRVTADGLSVLVLGSTFTECDKPYHTRELAEYLKSIGYDTHLVEDEKEDDNQHPMNLPIKMIRMANESDVVIMLVTNMGGTSIELPYIISLFRQKTIFLIRDGDELGCMVESHLSGSHTEKHKYDSKENLMSQAERCLTSFKLNRRLKETLIKQLKKAN